MQLFVRCVLNNHQKNPRNQGRKWDSLGTREGQLARVATYLFFAMSSLDLSHSQEKLHESESSQELSNRTKQGEIGDIKREDT
jgi:hypothetical protein